MSDESTNLALRFVHGKLDQAETAELEGRMASDTEFQLEVRMLRALVSVVMERGEQWETHPEHHDLVTFASVLERMAEQNPKGFEEVARHVSQCETCRETLAVFREHTRQGRESSRRPVRRLASRFQWRVLAPAMAAGFLAIFYSSYVSLVQLPDVRRKAQESSLALDSARRNETSLRRHADLLAQRLREASSWSGGASLLALSTPARGVASPVPTVALRAGQPFLPILIDYPLATQGPGGLAGRYEIILRRSADGREIWRIQRRGSELWDRETQEISLLVPTSSLGSGSYRLELRAAFSLAPLLQSRFTLTRPTGS